MLFTILDLKNKKNIISPVWQPALSLVVLGLTEPDAGSDPASMKTIAKKVEGGFFIIRFKTWITNSPIADLCIIWAKDEQGVLRGFIVERDSKELEYTSHRWEICFESICNRDDFYGQCFCT